ncbi:MAG: hypothetical protein IKP86_10940, partial [Anaerolineaceae bacterium]|nr:hypothetical protein [Anaerolineaceae bacterium]
IYPAIISPRQPSVFRLSCTFEEEIDPEILQTALNVTIKRYPGFCMTLKRGAFWFYFEELEKLPVLHPEQLYPCQMVDPEQEEGFLFRVSWFRKRVSLEVFHVISDGTGGLEFLKTLVYYYLLLSGKDVKPGDNVRTLTQKPTAEERENSFLRYYDPQIPPDRTDSAALHYQGTQLQQGKSRALHVRTAVKPLLDFAHDGDVTLTEYLTACFLRSFFKVMAGTTDSELPVKISVPINLRKLFPSDTLRNFTYFANLGEPLSNAGEPLEATLQYVRTTFRAMCRREPLISRINPNVSSEKNPLLRAAPLSIKQLVLRQAHHILGDNLFTASFSNLGVIRLDDSMNKYIRNFDFGLSCSDLVPLNLSMLSYGGMAYMTFSSIIQERDVERVFIRDLSEAGLDLAVYSSETETGESHEDLS